MKRCGGSLLVVALLALTPAWAQEGDEAMQTMMRLGQPGEHHEHLARMVGEWTYAIKMWMPGAPEPVETAGTMKAEPILGGRFVRAVWTGEFMGQPFEGIGTDGYDNAKGHYTSTWRDSMGTYTLHYTGGCEDEGNTRTMIGTFVDPATGEEVTDRGTTTFREDGTVFMESWRVLADADDVKTMEMVLTRK